MQLVRTQEVVISNPESEIIVGTIVVVESVCWTIRDFVSSIEALNHLLVRAKFCGNSVIIRKPDDLSDFKLEFLAEFMEELLGGERLGTIAVNDEAKVFGQFFQMLKSHANSHNARTDTTVI